MNVLPNAVEHQEQGLKKRENVAYEFEPWMYSDKINVAYGPSNLSNIIQNYGRWCC